MPSNNSKYTQEMREQTAELHTAEREISDERGGGIGHRHEYGVPLGEGLPAGAQHAQLRRSKRDREEGAKD